MRRRHAWNWCPPLPASFQCQLSAPRKPTMRLLSSLTCVVHFPSTSKELLLKHLPGTSRLTTSSARYPCLGAHRHHVLQAVQRMSFRRYSMYYRPALGMIGNSLAAAHTADAFWDLHRFKGPSAPIFGEACPGLIPTRLGIKHQRSA